MFKITDGSVGHLYNFPDFTWRKIEQSCDGTHLIMCFLIIIPSIVVKVEGKVSCPWPEYCNLLCNHSIYIGIDEYVRITSDQWPDLT
jgi:hypothetical protein